MCVQAGHGIAFDLPNCSRDNSLRFTATSRGHVFAAKERYTAEHHLLSVELKHSSTLLRTSRYIPGHQNFPMLFVISHMSR